MKKRLFVILGILVCLLTACKDDATIGIIGGADGPTSIFIGDKNTSVYIPDVLDK